MIGRLKSAVQLVFWVTVARLLPRRSMRFLFHLGGLLGRAEHAVALPRRRLVARELRASLPGRGEAELRRIARDAFMDWHRARVEYLCYPELNEQTVGQLIGLRGRELLDEALALGRGVLAVHPQFGSYMLILAALGWNGYRVSQVALRPPGFPGQHLENRPRHVRAEFNALNWQIYRYRVRRFEDALPAEFINVQSAMGLRDVYRKLRRNEVVAIAGTGRGGRGFVPVRLCGRQALLPVGPCEIARRSGAVLLPMFVVREGRGPRHTLEVEPAISMDAGGEAEAVQAGTQAFADALTRHIEAAPHQFAVRMALMRSRAALDDHPFFTDYAPDDRWRRYLDAVPLPTRESDEHPRPPLPSRESDAQPLTPLPSRERAGVRGMSEEEA